MLGKIVPLRASKKGLLSGSGHMVEDQYIWHVRYGRYYKLYETADVPVHQRNHCLVDVFESVFSVNLALQILPDR